MKPIHAGQIGFYMPDIGGGKSPFVILRVSLPPLVGCNPPDEVPRFEAYCPKQDIVLSFSYADFGTIEDARDHAMAALERAQLMPEHQSPTQAHLVALAEAALLAERLPEILRMHGASESPVPVNATVPAKG